MSANPTSNLTLEPKNQDVLSPSRADIISRTWQAVSIVEDLRNALNKNIRVSDARDRANLALTEATTQLVLAATLLIPSGLAGLT